MNALAHLEVVRAFLQQELGYPWWLGFADNLSGRYGVIIGPAWASGEEALAGPGQLLDTDYRVKVTTGTTLGVGIMLSNVRSLLWPNQHSTLVVVDGWRAETRWVRSEFVDVDQSITLPLTSRHPAFGVDTYRLVAEPDGTAPVVDEDGSDQGIVVPFTGLATWTYSHGLGRKPVVSFYDEADRLFAVGNLVVTDHVVIATFPTAQSGSMVLV